MYQEESAILQVKVP